MITRLKRGAELINRKQILVQKCNEWKDLKAHGDINLMALQFKVTRTAVSRAVNHGTGSMNLLQKVNDYYEQRKIAIRESNGI